jgi:16S rRNA (guanine527-N7)-methyltransferase
MSSSAVSVSRETIEEKFAAYLALLNKWQPTVNLVGADTLPDAKVRHFDDSIQLAEFIPASAKTLYDWGSGAGFPGLVLAMLRPDLQVTLVESDQRKCAFLRTVSRETKSPVKILDDRIVDIPVANVDLITARALAPLKELLAWALPWTQANPDVILLFPKGEKAEEELEAARKKYSFNLLKHPSKTAPSSAILEISGLCISTAA